MSSMETDPSNTAIRRHADCRLSWSGEDEGQVQEATCPDGNCPVPGHTGSMCNGHHESVPPRPKSASRHDSSTSIGQIHSILSDDQAGLDTFGVFETRDGFFDPLFLHPPALSLDDIQDYARQTLPDEFDMGSPQSLRSFIPRQWRQFKSAVRKLATTAAGIQLLKAFTGFFAAYVLCLVPTVYHWLGPYGYIMPISTIVNHSSRPFGSQIDGTVMTICGSAAGLAWGVVGLLLSQSSLHAEAGYGGILAIFLALFMASIAWMRSFIIRFYQAVLCAGISIAYTILGDTSSFEIKLAKFEYYAIPWLLGQAIALAVNCILFPDAGARRLAADLHEAFHTMQDALVCPGARDTRLRRRMAQATVDLSQTVRDLSIDISITRFQLEDVKDLRNKMQAVLRAMLSIDTEVYLFKDWDETATSNSTSPDESSHIRLQSLAAVRQDGPGTSEANASNINQHVVNVLTNPTKALLGCVKEGLLRCEATLMEMSGHRRNLGPPKYVSTNVSCTHDRIRTARDAFDAVESDLLRSGQLAAPAMPDSDIVQLFVFARHVREMAAAVEDLVAKVVAMQLNSDGYKFNLPSYPWRKAIHRTNAQVRHDRGGITAGSYHATFASIAALLDQIKSRPHAPLPNEPQHGVLGLVPKEEAAQATLGADEADAGGKSKSKDISYKVWRVLHRLQGFESRYALKVCLVTSLLAVPSYLHQSKWWWDEYEAWWAVAMSWIIMHPRVGGNVQDLFARSFAAILGALWSHAAHAAGRGSPYVTAVFSAIYMVPMLYRFTLSAHPRSGLVGCFSFTVISLSLQTHNIHESHIVYALRRGLVFFVGTTVPILVNWVLWPFIARRELRFALSSMMFFLSIIYRSVVAKYVYFQEGGAPTAQDIEKSGILEGRLREGFVRIRQLLVMTRHELRPRAPFDPLPYSALAEACERFFEYLISVRQSALVYNPDYIRDNPVAAQKLLGHRRDAVAAILGNLYVLAGALQSQRQVPRYLPNAAAARKKLLIKTAEVEEEMSRHGRQQDIKWQKQWSDIYSYSYNESLTGCVAQLEELELYTKLIVGEQSIQDAYTHDELAKTKQKASNRQL